MANPNAISTLLSTLAGYSGSSVVNNFYLSPHLLANLGEYFSKILTYPFSGDLLVGEAPGWAGCTLTSIPFTSEFVVKSSAHPFMNELRACLRVTGAQKEPTATIVWEELTRRNNLPAFWNAFPLHPHELESHRNRPPTASEEAFGVATLAIVIDIIAPRRVFAIGRTAESTLKRHFPHLSAPYIRHPSNGGKCAFVDGMISNQIV